ncbi:hypothetical protein [Natronorubrum sp. FCH18a]|uniref:hypothetical protein n=1 Tax=Natronorubrum sp. FCH18a TaxID=3447018 RepID=UPI003F5153D8
MTDATGDVGSPGSCGDRLDPLRGMEHVDGTAFQTGLAAPSNRLQRAYGGEHRPRALEPAPHLERFLRHEVSSRVGPQ